jgi:hypothetical protein
MFVQVIQAKVKDRDGFERQMDRWTKELQPGAKGFLGSTGGVSPDGTMIALVRFESEAAAQANGARPEQDAWFQEMSKSLDGAPTFRNSTDTDTMGQGGSDSAGFVQVMISQVSDRAKLEALEAQVMPKLMASRPDIFGSLRVWDGDTCIDAIYFESEAKAREEEATMGEEMAPEMEQLMALSSPPTFIDLPNPILRSA